MHFEVLLQRTGSCVLSAKCVLVCHVWRVNTACDPSSYSYMLIGAECAFTPGAVGRVPVYCAIEWAVPVELFTYDFWATVTIRLL
jgi:hypothetical protein